MEKSTPKWLANIFFTINPKARNALFYFLSFIAPYSTKTYFGWGRKKTGEYASQKKIKHGGKLIRLEDGFIRSLGLGVNKSPSFSLVEDDIGIYLDATQPSKLENILNDYSFSNDTDLINTANKAISLIKQHHISKYNHAPTLDKNHFTNSKNIRVLIIAQTAGDASLEYGLANENMIDQMIEDAITDNPYASIYLKVHPDVISGKKQSSISLAELPQRCEIISQDMNPISLLEQMDIIYTCTSGMGMEALILGKKVICYGIPFYAGWGLTEDKQKCHRRQRKLTIEELFSGAYILYTQYYNPYQGRSSDIIDTINEIVKQRKLAITKTHNAS